MTSTAAMTSQLQLQSRSQPQPLASFESSESSDEQEPVTFFNSHVTATNAGATAENNEAQAEVNGGKKSVGTSMKVSKASATPKAGVHKDKRAKVYENSGRHFRPYEHLEKKVGFGFIVAFVAL